MAFVLRLSPEETESLRELAAREHRSMHEVAMLAIKARIAAAHRAEVIDGLFDAAAVEDAALLDRLAR
jgi:predicted transcriptional regulator